jgi:hypothetical protein
MDGPHTMAMDSRGRLFLGVRGNNLAADAMGNILGAEVGPKRVNKYVKK